MLQLDLYLKEISTFLRSLVIKYDELDPQMRETQVKTEYQNALPNLYNPYYRTLWGEYLPRDGVVDFGHGTKIPSYLVYQNTAFTEYMYVTPLETLKQGVNFNDFLENYGVLISKSTFFKIGANNRLIKNGHRDKTLEALRSRGELYQEVCAKYPSQRQLLDAILWPLAETYTSVEQIVAAENLALLNYDLSVLHEAEQQSILAKIQKVLTHARVRWFPDRFTYEKYYATDQYAMLFQILFLSILEQRFYNIRTHAVHPFHIREYLSSKGLADYYPYLSYEQNAWFYRNIEYLYANRGREEICLLLADQLLPSATKLMVKSLALRADKSITRNCVPIPEFISEEFGANDAPYASFINGTEEHRRLFGREHDTGLEPEETDAIVSRQYQNLTKAPHTYAPTKLLEIKNQTQNLRFQDRMSIFYLETALVMLTRGDINFKIEVRDKLNSYGVKLNADDVIPLLCYCTLRKCYSHNEILDMVVPSNLKVNYALKKSCEMTVTYPAYVQDGILVEGGTYTCNDIEAIVHWLNSTYQHKHTYTATEILGVIKDGGRRLEPLTDTQLTKLSSYIKVYPDNVTISGSIVHYRYEPVYENQFLIFDQDLQRMVYYIPNTGWIYDIEEHVWYDKVYYSDISGCRIEFEGLPDTIMMSYINKYQPLIGTNLIKRPINFHDYWSNFVVATAYGEDSDVLVRELIFEPDASYSSGEETLALADKQWGKIYRYMVSASGTAVDLEHHAYEYLYQALRDRTVYQISAGIRADDPDAPVTYREYIGDDVSTPVGAAIRAIKEQDIKIIDEIFEMMIKQVMPVDQSVYNTIPDIGSIYYRKAKELFNKLCSYNIAMLDIDTDLPKTSVGNKMLFGWMYTKSSTEYVTQSVRTRFEAGVVKVQLPATIYLPLPNFKLATITSKETN